ncbi:hypothetical protein GCM10027168_10230 [Streptomyces capparidis]
MDNEPLAVVGVGCTLPGGVRNLDQARVVFEEGRDCIREIPPDRWAVDDLYHPDPMEAGRTYVRHGGFVDDVDRFDAAFFGMSDVEATHMDPQQRLLLQTVWHAFEHAGHDPEEVSGTDTGLFVALMAYDYTTLKLKGGLAAITAYEAMDTDSISAGRVAHFLGMQGPCVTVDTACSGSLVALHLARQSILTGECDTAVVAGANLILAPNVHISFSKMGLFSRGGQCRSFDAGADGYVRSEGCIAAVLKRQSLAEEQGDPILATIVGTAVNHTGRTRTLTAPDGASQRRVIRKALAGAGVDPSRVGYVEAHGTGTPVGDPIEMEAIARTYGTAERPDGHPLWVSSGKSNMGHIEAGAGLLGVVRAALSLDRETIYPSLHLQRLNPKIDLTGTPVRIPTAPVPWPRNGTPRMAAVNSFGYSGTNAHALLREAPAPRPATGGDTGDQAAAPRADELLVLSAKSVESLHELADRWADHLSRTAPADLPAAVYTAAAGRARLRHRLAVTGSSGTDLANSLRQWRTGRTPAALRTGRARPRAAVGFVFTGQGTQYTGMARELYAGEPVFAAAIDRCARAMDDELGLRLHDVLFGEAPNAPRGAAGIDDTRLAQPALFAVGYALAELLRSWGVEPAAVAGHSIGEITAACTAGMLTLEQAARFSVARGRLMSEMPRTGRMLTVSASERTVRPWLEGRQDIVAVAAVNGPASVVLSGDAAAVEEIADLAARAGVDTAWLRTSHAFHSPLVDQVLPALHARADALTPTAPGTPVISCLTGRPLTGDEGADHWTGQARQAVRLHDAVRAMIESGCTALVEIGPQSALTRHLRAIADAVTAADDTPVTVVPTLEPDGRDVRHLLDTAGALFTAGVPIDLPRLYQGPRYRRSPAAPQYPFRKDRYWWDGRSDTAASGVRTTAEPVSAPAPSVPAPSPETTIHDRPLTTTAPWSDHRVHGATVFPGTGYLELAVRAWSDTGGTGAVELRDVHFSRPLVLHKDATTVARLTLAVPGGQPGAGRRFTIAADTGGGSWTEHCHGTVSRAGSAPAGPALDALRATVTGATPPTRLYGMLRDGGLEHGFHFATVRELWLAPPGEHGALARITAAPHEADEDHPHRTATVLDGCLQLAAAPFLTPGSDLRPGGYVPVRVGRLFLPSPLPDRIWAHVRRLPHDAPNAFLVDVVALDDDGAVAAALEGVEFRHAGALADPSGSAAEAAVTGGRGLSRRELLDQLLPLDREGRRQAVVAWLTVEVEETLGKVSAEMENVAGGIDPSLALLEIGLDSLKVTALQRRIQEKLEFRFAAMEALDYQTVEGLADFLLDRVLTLGPDSTPAPAGTPA